MVSLSWVSHVASVLVISTLAVFDFDLLVGGGYLFHMFQHLSSSFGSFILLGYSQHQVFRHNILYSVELVHT